MYGQAIVYHYNKMEGKRKRKRKKLKGEREKEKQEKKAEREKEKKRVRMTKKLILINLFFNVCKKFTPRVIHVKTYLTFI